MVISNEQVRNIGTAIAITGCIISGIGVIVNNILLEHIIAMQIWRFSNILFVAYFFGNWKRWWEGGLSSGAMCILYAIFALTNEWGLNHG